MNELITGPTSLADLPLSFANSIALGFGLAFMVYSLAYLVTVFRKFVDDSLKK